MQNVAYGDGVDLSPNVVYALLNDERCKEKKNCLIHFMWTHQIHCQAKFVCFHSDGKPCENAIINLKFENKVNKPILKLIEYF